MLVACQVVLSWGYRIVVNTTDRHSVNAGSTPAIPSICAGQVWRYGDGDDPRPGQEYIIDGVDGDHCTLIGPVGGKHDSPYPLKWFREGVDGRPSPWTLVKDALNSYCSNCDRAFFSKDADYLCEECRS